MSPEEKFYLGVGIVIGLAIVLCLTARFFSGEDDIIPLEGGAKPPPRTQSRPARLRKAERFVVKPSGIRVRR